MRQALAGLMLMATFSANAGTLFCDNCTSTQKKAVAKAASPGTQYVVDRINGTVSKYDVEVTCTDAPPSVCKGTFPLTVESQVVNYVNFVIAHPSASVSLPNSGNLPNDGYEDVEFPQLSQNVGSYIKNSGTGLIQDFLNFLGSVNPFTGFDPSAMQMTITVHYPDGSTSMYTYDHITQTWVRVKGQTRDANNNPVPETPSDVSGGVGSSIEYNFTGDSSDLASFLYRMEQFGIPVTGPVGGTFIMCWTDSNGTHCTSSRVSTLPQ